MSTITVIGPAVPTVASWTPERLTALLVENGVAVRLAARQPDGLLFTEQSPTPTRLAPGAPVHPTTACLVWLGALRTGYGLVGVAGRMRQVTRVVAELLGTPIADHLTAAHLCEERACCRPDHFRPLDNRSNAAEGRNRRYPDEFLALAPPVVPCPTCHGTDIAVTVNVGPGRRPRWQHTCAHCRAAYLRAWRRGEQAPRGLRFSPMNAFDRAALRHAQSAFDLDDASTDLIAEATR